MNDLNEQLMNALTLSYRKLRLHMVQGILDDAQLGNSPFLYELPARETAMEQKNAFEQKNAVLQRDLIIREISIITKNRIGGVPEEAHLVSEKKLADYLNVRPQQLAESITTLEHDGYLNRIKVGIPRKVQLSLTEKGLARAEELEQIKARQNAEFLKPLTAEERQTLLTLLNKLNMAEEMGLSNP